MSFEVKPRILVIRFSSIGDIVLTSPVVRCLKLQLDAEVHFLTKASFASILEANPYVDRVHAFKDDLDIIIRELKGLSFNYVIDLHNNLRSWRVQKALQAPVFRFNKTNWQKWLLVNAKINRMPELHVVDRYMLTVRSLQVENDGKGLDYFIPKGQKVNVKRLIKELTGHSMGRSEGYTAIAIGAAHATKRMPFDLLVQICRGVKGIVLLLGGPGDLELGAAIEKATRKEVINLCGQLSLHGSASVVEQAIQVISPDTGMMHIASAFKKPILSVWGNTVPEFGMFPYYPNGLDLNISFQVSDLACRPCSKIGFGQCPKKHFKCMMEQSVSMIVQMANKQVETYVQKGR